jgi:hypothetical protein
MHPDIVKFWKETGYTLRQSVINGLFISAVGTKYYYLNDKLHREDGPAVECADGTKHWFLNDKLLDVSSQKEFEQYKRLIAFQ